MKFANLICCFLAFSLFDCNKGGIEKSVANGSNKTVVSDKAANKETSKEATMESVTADANRLGNIEYSIKIRTVKKGMRDGINYTEDTFYVDYTVKNSGADDYLLFNQGHTNDSNKNAVYAETQPNGVVEFSQKAFAQPTNKQCPATDAPVLPRASILRAGETIKNQVKVTLGSKPNTPFADCAPADASLAEVKNVKFCLGAVKTDKNVKVDADGNITGLKSLAEQKFLCSEMSKL